MPTILKDVFSTCRRGVQYAAAGDEVSVIADHGSVLIVENTRGNRFPIKKSVITGEAEEHPSFNQSNPIARKTKTKKKPSPQIQQPLF